jgi:hypothetical protein
VNGNDFRIMTYSGSGNVTAPLGDAVAHAVITYAQSTEAVDGVRGKGNVGLAATGAGAQGGAASGGEDAPSRSRTRCRREGRGAAALPCGARGRA